MNTETTTRATHVWPCTGQLERADVTLIHDVLMPAVMCQYTPAVLRPGSGRRPMWWAFAQLGRRIGVDVLPTLDLDTATDDDVLALALQPARLGLEELRAAGNAGQPVVTELAVFGWVHRPYSSVMLILFVLATAYHSYLGVRVVIEDYVPGNGPKVLALMGSAFAHASLTIAAVFAILKVAFGPAA